MPGVRLLPCLALALALGACAGVPPADDDLASLDVGDVQRAVPAEPVTVRWGGTITKVTNTDADTTELEVVSRPLDRGGRPRHVDVSEGRFLAVVQGFLDPEIVRAGRDVTVTGEVGELRDGRIGEAGYRFPVLRVDDYRYWKPRATAAGVPGPYGPYGYGAYGAGIGPYGYAPGYYHDPFDFQQRFWHDFWHDPIHTPYRGGGRRATGVVVNP